MQSNIYLFRITNSPIADVFIVWAKTDSENNRIKGFILEKGQGIIEFVLQVLTVSSFSAHNNLSFTN